MKKLIILISALYTLAVSASENLPNMGPILEEAKSSTVYILVLEAKEPTQVLPAQIRDEFLSNPDLMSYFQEKLGREFNELLSPLGMSAGSGAIVSSDGYIITNEHVVRGGQQIYVQLNDKSLYVAQLIGKDKETDLALLKIDAQDLPYFELNQDELTMGQWVFAIGSPYSLSQSISFGIVSALKRAGRQSYTNFIQHDAACNPGNSGGPLINPQGELIGINSWGIVSSIQGTVIPNPGLCFAVPSRIVQHVMETLKSFREIKRGWVGMSYQNLDPMIASGLGLKDSKGVIVSHVWAQGPAEQAGIQVGDVIRTFDEESIDTIQDLNSEISIASVDESVTVEIIRDDQSKKILMTIEAYPRQKNTALRKPIEKPQKSVIAVRDLEPEEKDSEVFGVAIVRVEGGYFAGADLRRGDVIMSLDNTHIQNESHFVKLWQNRNKSTPTVLLIHRPGVGNFYESVGLATFLSNKR